MTRLFFSSVGQWSAFLSSQKCGCCGFIALYILQQWVDYQIITWLAVDFVLMGGLMEVLCGGK